MLPTTPYESILEEVSSIAKPRCLEVASQHIEHHTITSGPPVFLRPRWLYGEPLEIAQRELEYMQALGIIRHFSSCWAAALRMVPKKDPDNWRPCGGYQAVPDRCPLPHIQDFTAYLAGTTIFSRIDLVKSYHQILVAPQNILKTTVISPFGLLECLLMPFGLRNASQTFQRFVNDATGRLPFVYAYIEDLPMATATPEEHRQNLCALFSRLDAFRLVLNIKKCIFGVSLDIPYTVRYPASFFKGSSSPWLAQTTFPTQAPGVPGNSELPLQIHSTPRPASPASNGSTAYYERSLHASPLDTGHCCRLCVGK